MFASLRSLGLGLLFCGPTLAVLRDWPNNTSPFLSPRAANTSITITTCGINAAPGNETCPLNVCCSEYGNCGTTIDFCGKGCQNNCEQPQLSTCLTNNSASARTVGYYESWANARKCQNVSPGDLNVTGFTHVNYASLAFDPITFAIAKTAESDGPLATEFTNLKTANPGLQTWIAIGGWNFTEPGPTATAFSDMVGCRENRTKFINEITSFMQTYAFDGVDIDWECPVAAERGGKPADKDNLVLLTQEIRAAFGQRYGLSVTLPASYFYMKNFDLAGMQQHVDFFNVMSYDMHGIWDKDTKGAGPYILPHTNLTEMDSALDLLWRSNVSSEKVNLGLAWYGCLFTLQDSNCTTPNGV
jgi:chitinase